MIGRWILGALCAGVAALPAGAACTLGKLAELPVTMSGPRPMVPATINGHEALFIADSGAFFSLISPGVAAAWKLPQQQMAGATLTGLGGSTSMSVAKVKDFGLAGIMLHHIDFAVGGSDTGASGLIGQNILGFADVEYDLAAGVIRLFKPADCQKTSLAYWAGTKPYSVMPIEARSGVQYHTVGTVMLNGVKLTATFDTGAPTSIVSLDAAARAGVRPGMAGVEPAGIGSGLGTGTYPVWRAHFKSFGIGDNEEVRSIDVRIGKLGMNGLDMLVGADFFLSHRVYVSNSQRRLYVSYNGGPVFGNGTRAQQPAGVIAATDPVDADSLARRGAARAARRDLPGGLADLDKAVTMAPKDAHLRQVRAGLLAASGRAADARKDLDEALLLKPDDMDSRLARGWLEVGAHDEGGARADADLLDKALAPQDDRRRGLAGLFERLNAFDRSIAQYDQWLKAHGEDSGRADAFNGRCWMRALWGRELDRALSDCNAALRLRPGTPEYLDSRGLVHLRMGAADAALADYNAALAREDAISWSHYGRGLIEKARGQAEAARKDEAAALKLEPDLADQARRYGITAGASLK